MSLHMNRGLRPIVVLSTMVTALAFGAGAVERTWVQILFRAQIVIRSCDIVSGYLGKISLKIYNKANTISEKDGNLYS